GAVAFALRREERLEDAARVIGRDAGAVVGDTELELATLGLARFEREAARAFGHRVTRVGDQVDEHLLELRGDAEQLWQCRCDVHLDAYAALCDDVVAELERALEEPAHVEYARLLGARTRISEQLARKA